MDSFFIFLGSVALLIFAIRVIFRLRSQGDELRSLRARLSALETTLRTKDAEALRIPVNASAAQPPTPPATAHSPPPIPGATERIGLIPVASLPEDAAHAPPPLPVLPFAPPGPPKTADNPPLTGTPIRVPRTINWEQFMGVKLFAWLGGLALFLGAVFFIKLSIEQGWISPELRVALGFLLGGGLIVGGLVLSRRKLAVTAQTLCATGIVTLYAMTFAAYSIYGYFGQILAFGLMILITAVAFALALRLRAKVVAVLGLLGGFLTPILLSNGQQNTVGLFSYIAFLDAGLLAVALASGWRFLVPLAAAGTTLMEIAWGFHFLNQRTASTAASIAATFDFIFLAGAAAARRRRALHPAFSLSVAGLALFSFVLAGYLGIGGPPELPVGQWLAFLFFVDLCVIGVVCLCEDGFGLNVLSGVAVFTLLGAWTTESLNDALLPWALGAYLGYAALHSLFPLVLRRVQPQRRPVPGSQLFPLLTLILLLGPTLSRLHGSLALWPVVLILDGLVIAVATLTRSALSLTLALILTLLIAGSALFQLPSNDPPGILFLVIAGFAMLFFATGLRSKFSSGNASAVSGQKRPQAQVALSSTLLPFALLVLASGRSTLPTPHALFAVSLLLVLMAFAAAYLLEATAMPIFALLGVALVAETWTLEHFPWDHLTGTLSWYALFYFLFLAYPFFGYDKFREKRGPWFASALAGPVFFWLTYSLFARAWPHEKLGWLAAVLALPPAAAAWLVSQREKMPTAGRLERLALYAGAASGFVALIFPLQFQRQWITTGWALEGVALLWLFRRLPHRGLAALGAGLLVASFVRLAFNPAVFAYQLHRATPIFNGYLFTYGVATLSLIGAARLATPPPLRLLGLNVPAWLNILAGVLLFLLINIEIADYFSDGRARLTFEFSGNFGRDMAYTVAWAAYALLLLVIGIWRQMRGCRYAAVALLATALAKLFLHDLAQLAQLYRVGALVGVAVIAFIASVLYQRFVPAEKTPPPLP